MNAVWSMVALGELCQITMGQAPPGASYNEAGNGLPLLAGAGDFKDGKAAPKKFTTAATKIALQGDIILGIRASVGDKVWADRTYCLGRGVAALRPSTSHLDSRYLWHWLTEARPHLVAKGRGATFLQVNRCDISQLTLLLPAIEEQRRIAAILDHAESLVELASRPLSLLRALPRQALDCTLSASQSVTTLGAHLEFLTSGSRGWAKYYSDAGDTFIRIQNVQDAALDLSDVAYVQPPTSAEAARTRVTAGDVLLSITADLGRTAVVPPDLGTAYINQHLALLRLEGLDPTFVAYYLGSTDGRQQLMRGAIEQR